MAIEIVNSEPVGPGRWRLAWNGGTPPYAIYRDGAKIGATRETAWVFALAPGERPVIEVLEDSAEAPPARPGRFLLTWHRVSGAERYRIEEKVSGTWTFRREVRDEGLEYLTYRTRWLEDDTTHEFRVMAIDAAGNQGTALALSGLMIRYPDPPPVSYSYDDQAGEVTVSAA